MTKYRANKPRNSKDRGIKITRLMKRDGDKCSICGDALNRKHGDGDPAQITFDHVVPRSKGGRDEFENIKLAHALCNQRKGDQLPELDPVTADDDAGIRLA
jgi:5-methylcytosine-specific restriction endonuclease McrA